MAISRERDTATHQPRDTKAPRRRRILGRIAEPPALSVCGACAGRRRQTDASLRGPQGGAAQRSAGRGSGERAPPAHPASREPGRRAARSPAAAARPSSAAGSPAATWTRVRRPRAPSPRAGPRSGQPTPAQVRAFPSLPVPPHTLPRASRGLRGAVIGTYTTALEIIQDTIFPGAGTPHLPGGWAQSVGGPSRQRQAARSPAPGAPRGRAGALGSRARCVRAAASAARRSVPRPSPPVSARPRICRGASRPRPCAPLIGGGGGGGALAEARPGPLGSGVWAIWTRAYARRPGARTPVV